MSPNDGTEQPKHKFSFKTKHLLIVTTIAAILLGLYLLFDKVTDNIMSDIMFGQSGEITDPADWPRPLITIQNAAIDLGLPIDSIDVYCLADGLALNNFLWKIKADQDLIDHLILNHKDILLYDLEPYIPSESNRFRSQKSLPTWWDPNENNNHNYYSANRCGLGNQFVIFQDLDNQVIYTWYNYN